MPKKSRKKSRRAKYQAAKPVRAQAKYPQPAAVYRPEPKITTPSTKEFVSPGQVAAHYEYVIPELRRIGIIAGVLFLILIILAFVLG